MEKLEFKIPKSITVKDLSIVDEMLMTKEIYAKIADSAFRLLDMDEQFDNESKSHMKLKINTLALISDRRQRKLCLRPECIFDVHLNTYRFNRFQVLAFKYASMEALFIELNAYKKEARKLDS